MNKNILMLCALLASAQGLANDNANTAGSEQEHAAPGFTHSVHFGVGHAAFDASVVDDLRANVKDSATYVALGWQGEHSNVIVGAGLSFYLYSDLDGFSQQVEDTFGDVSTSDSDAQGIAVYGEAGYRFNIREGVYFDLLGGYEVMASSERSISNCSNCYSEDIEIDSGLFVTPRINHEWDNGVKAFLSYSHYFSGDVEGVLSAGIGIHF